MFDESEAMVLVADPMFWWVASRIRKNGEHTKVRGNGVEEDGPPAVATGREAW